MADGFQVPPGMLAITTYGSITANTANSLAQMLEHNVRRGLTNMDTRFIIGNLVDKTRNEAAREMLANPAYQYIWYVDGDMEWHPTLAEVMLTTAYGDPSTKDFDIIGGYCNLRGKPYLPTIDTGTGTWEPHDAGIGPVEVIRTGGACLLIKRHVFERMEYPWFGTRPVPRPIDMLAEVDNYARIKFDGRNPFWGTDWESLLRCAREDAVNQRARTPNKQDWIGTVGEDSGVCDKAKALGFRILVQTNAVCGHVDRKVIWPEDHRLAIKEAHDRQKWYAGVR
jgi:hypothetical protein